MSPSAGLRYGTVRWSGTDGYTQYGSYAGSVWTEWNAGLPKNALSGKVITYEQTYLVPTLGLDVAIPAGTRFNAEAGIVFSPFASCDAVDGHLLTGKEYHDYLRGGMLVEPSLRASWALTRSGSMAVFAEAILTRIYGLRGRTESVDTATGMRVTYSRANGGGGEYATETFRLGLTTRLR